MPEPVQANPSVIDAYSAQSMTGETIELGQLVGHKPMYIKIWASWCIPCNEQMPHFQSAYEAFGDRVQFLSVNLGINDDRQSVQAMIDKYGLTMPTIVDQSGKLAKAFNLIGTPWHILLDRNSNLVHQSHDTNDALNRRLKLMAGNQTSDLPEIQSAQPDQRSLHFEFDRPGVTALYFTSTWCDWYLEDSRPAYSKNCREGQALINRLVVDVTGVNWQGVLSRLWTTDKELSEYRSKYHITHPLAIDHSNDAFIGFGVQRLPTLILLKQGKELDRITDFSDEEAVKAAVKRTL